MDSLRVIVADDSQFMRVAYRRILETQEHLEVVGMAGDGIEALRLAETLAPDVAILDVRMPGMTGIEVAQRITARNPGTGIVIISAYDDTQYVVELLRRGARGKAYLLKTSIDEIDELIRAVEAVAAGHTVLDPAIVRRLILLHSTREGSPLLRLAELELEVLALMTEGHTDAFIAESLAVSEETVSAHMRSIYSKLGLTAASAADQRIQAILALVEQTPAGAIQ